MAERACLFSVELGITGPVGGKRVVQRKMGGCGVKTWGTSAKLMDF